MLTALPLTDNQWKAIAKNGGWHFIRMNLNTFVRHNVFSDPKMVKFVTDKLSDATEIRKSKVFPYQLMTAYLNTGNDVPAQVRNALQDAVEIATENIPTIDGKVYIMVDTSGSMGSPVTGNRGTASSVMRCIDVAALISASIMRKNPDAEVLPFDTSVHSHNLNPRDSIMTNAQKLAGYGGGGTDCSKPLAQLNARNAKGDLIIYVSDNESWADSNRIYGYSHGTGTAQEFDKFQKRNPKAKMVCIDLTPNTTAQAQDNKSIMNIGGFSDSVFDVINSFYRGGLESENWLSIIEAIKLG
jgi:60 kDa SS-A/Ro ribonucleoprotein